MQRLVRFATAASLCLLTVCAGCGEGEVSIGGRLWIDAMPDSPRAPIAAFVVSRPEEGKGRYGSFYRGSLLRGGHDVFAWREDSDDPSQVTLRLLQDGREVAIRVARCEPSPGFDHCVTLEGDPQGARRYQSRRRWGAPESAGFEVRSMLTALAAEDAELAALLPNSPDER